MFFGWESDLAVGHVHKTHSAVKTNMSFVHFISYVSILMPTHPLCLPSLVKAA